MIANATPPKNIGLAVLPENKSIAKWMASVLNQRRHCFFAGVAYSFAAHKTKNACDSADCLLRSAAAYYLAGKELEQRAESITDLMNVIFLFGKAINMHYEALDLIQILLKKAGVQEIPTSKPTFLFCNQNGILKKIAIERKVVNPFGNQRILIDECGSQVELAARRIFYHSDLYHCSEVKKRIASTTAEALVEASARGINTIKDYMPDIALELDDREAVHIENAITWASAQNDYKLAVSLRKELVSLRLMQRNIRAAVEQITSIASVCREEHGAIEALGFLERIARREEDRMVIEQANQTRNEIAQRFPLLLRRG